MNAFKQVQEGRGLGMYNRSSVQALLEIERGEFVGTPETGGGRGV